MKLLFAFFISVTIIPVYSNVSECNFTCYQVGQNNFQEYFVSGGVDERSCIDWGKRTLTTMTSVFGEGIEYACYITFGSIFPKQVTNLFLMNFKEKYQFVYKSQMINDNDDHSVSIRNVGEGLEWIKEPLSSFQGKE